MLDVKSACYIKAKFYIFLGISWQQQNHLLAVIPDEISRSSVFKNIHAFLNVPRPASDFICATG